MSATMRIVVGAVIGAAVGYTLYRVVGCRTGACPLTANPWISMAVYAAIGALAVGGR